MAVTPADPRACIVLAMLGSLLLGTCAAEAAGPRGRSGEDIVLDAASSDIDYRGNMLRFKDVVISQGDVRISAQQAEANGTGLTFDNSNWRFSGDVRIRFADGNLQSDAATISFTGNRVARATITGAPARFEQRLENLDQPARGRAGNIDYDLVNGNVRLSQDAWLSDGRNEISSQVLVYSLRDQRVQTEQQPAPANAEAGTETGTGKDRVHITIRPPDPGEAPARPDQGSAVPATPEPGAAPAPKP